MILENCPTGLLPPGKPVIRSAASITHFGFIPHHGCFPPRENLCRLSNSYGQILGQTSVIQKLAKEQLLLAIHSSVTPPRDKNCELASMPTVSRWRERRSPKSAPNMKLHCWLSAALRIAPTAPRIRTITVSFGSPHRILLRS